jgi:hypothetical protein
MLRVMTQTQKRGGGGEEKRLHDKQIHTPSGLSHGHNAEGREQKQSGGERVQIVQ